MTSRTILTAPHPVLKQISAPVKKIDSHIQQLMHDMLDSMYEAGGIGLAAVQIGEPIQVIVMDLARNEEPPNPQFFVNPKILESSAQTRSHEEGCLSVPDINETIKRPERVLLRYLNYHGKEISEWAEGLYAVCIQHEIDHLQGILFIDHLSRLKREYAMDKLRKIKREILA